MSIDEMHMRKPCCATRKLLPASSFTRSVASFRSCVRKEKARGHPAGLSHFVYWVNARLSFVKERFLPHRWSIAGPGAQTHAIREPEVGRAVSSKVGANQRKDGRVPVDGQQTAVGRQRSGAVTVDGKDDVANHAVCGRPISEEFAA